MYEVRDELYVIWDGNGKATGRHPSLPGPAPSPPKEVPPMKNRLQLIAPREPEKAYGWDPR